MSTAFPRPPGPPSQPPKLRLWDADTSAADDGPQLSPDMTLTQFFAAYVLPVCLAGCAPRNAKEYRHSLTKWRRITLDPSLRAVTDFTCATFVAGLHESPGRKRGELMANPTIRKHAIEIQSCLDKAGPRSRWNPQGAGLIAEPPRILKPAHELKEVEGNFALQEIAWFLEACRTARQPQIAGVSATDWWRAIAIFDYNTGPRPSALMRLRYADLLENEWGWSLPVPTQRSRTKRSPRLYLNGHALAAIESIRTPRELIFEVGHNQNWLHHRMREICARSQIVPHRRFGFMGFRKAVVTEMSKYNATAAEMLLGHGKTNVTRDHYQHRSILIDALAKLPQPAWTAPDPQRLLF